MLISLTVTICCLLFFFLLYKHSPLMYFDVSFSWFPLNSPFSILLILISVFFYHWIILLESFFFFFLSLPASFPLAITVPQLAHFALRTLTFSLFLVTMVCSWNQEGIFLHGLTLYPLNICLLLSLVVKLLIWCSNVLVIIIFLNKNNLVSYLTE